MLKLKTKSEPKAIIRNVGELLISQPDDPAQQVVDYLDEEISFTGPKIQVRIAEFISDRVFRFVVDLVIDGKDGILELGLDWFNAKTGMSMTLDDLSED